MMQTQFIEEKISYDGTQLHSLFAYSKFGILGDSCVAFQGPCDVSFEHMVDVEDLRDQAKICGSNMLHLIIEIFDRNLFSAVCLQRLIADLAATSIESSSSVSLIRDGDDLYHNGKKLSISIACSSPISQLVHFAVNVTNEGTPVKTCALTDFDLTVQDFVGNLLPRISREYESILMATRKARPVQ